MTNKNEYKAKKKDSFVLTNLRPLNTLRPSTNSNIMSNNEAVTIIKSNIFQPHRKNSLDNAINFIIHSNVNIEVNT